MADEIRFDDGAAYERYMGVWSRYAGDAFLDWLALGPGLRWLDVGCGSGAFTEAIAVRSSPRWVGGIDPSEAQLAFARTRPALSAAELRQGDAMALPFPDDSCDVAVMSLVIFFVPDPAKGIAEMARVVNPGGTVAAYAWDMHGGGFPYEPLLEELRGLGVEVPIPPSTDASRIDAMRSLWLGAGLEAVETRQIVVQRTFVDFEEYWTTLLAGSRVGPTIAAMADRDREHLRSLMAGRLTAAAARRITCGGRAGAVKGRVPSGQKSRPS